MWMEDWPHLEHGSMNATSVARLAIVLPTILVVSCTLKSEDRYTKTKQLIRGCVISMSVLQVVLCGSQLQRMPEIERNNVTRKLNALDLKLGVMGCIDLCNACSNKVVARIEGAPTVAATWNELIETLEAALPVQAQ